MNRAIRFGLSLVGQKLEPRRDGCLWINDDLVIESIESAATCPAGAAGGGYYLILPPAALTHAHSADVLFPEYGIERTLHELVSYPDGLKHRLLSGLSMEDMERSALLYYEDAYRRGVGLVVDFRERGGIGCLSAKYAVNKINKISIIVLGRPGPLFPQGCDGIGISSPLDYDRETLRKLTKKFKIKATHIAETPATRAMGDLERALDAGFNVFVHGTHLSRRDIDLIEQHEVSLILCIRSNMWHGMGLPDLAYILKKDILLGIGTDNAAWLPPDPWEEASTVLLAARLQGARDKGLAKRIVRSLFIDGYAIYGYRPQLVCEGCDASLLVVALADDSVLTAFDPYYAIIKRVRPRGSRILDIIK